jgi:hypothetical protein
MPDPVDTLTFSKSTTNLINKYYSLSASGDSTAASQFFSQNASVLGPAFDLEAQHSNALRTAKGELNLQGYPTESAHVTQVLDSMPSGSDTASKETRSTLINNNPDVNQYLANIALYEALDKGAQYRYVNPASPKATEGQNINAGGQTGQSVLKDITSLGSYDIAKNAAGDYSFMQNGTFPTGYSAGSGSSSSESPLVAMPPYAKKPPRHSAGKLHLEKERVKNIRLKKPTIAPIRIGHGGPLHASAVINIKH